LPSFTSGYSEIILRIAYEKQSACNRVLRGQFRGVSETKTMECLTQLGRSVHRGRTSQPQKVGRASSSGVCLNRAAMKATYFDEDDTFVIRLSDKPVVREMSQDWNTRISYAENGTAVELVVLEAHAHSVMPPKICHTATAL
jgi:hypothetical protein